MIIISGPGSGKTRVITSKIAYLIINNISPSNILSLTFTNKSAKEMIIRAQEMIPNHNIKNLWIGTFHSVFAKILRIEAEIIGFKNNFTIDQLKKDKKFLEKFSKLDDYEIYTCLKYWINNSDYVLSNLSRKILNRDLLKIKIQKNKFDITIIENCKKLMIKNEKINSKEAEFFIFSEKVSNSLYTDNDHNIKILFKEGYIKDFSNSSEQFENNMFNKTINKYFFCFPKEYHIK